MIIALIGYGKMGREIESIALQRGHSVVSRFTSASPLPTTPSDVFNRQQIHCCIDFSHASLVANHANICSLAGIPLIEGTTGWHEQKKDILFRVKEHNGTLIYGNNFSIGAQLFFRIVRNAAQLMNAFSDYDVAVHETHHTKKKDSPSGTAITIANEILSQIERKSSLKKSDDRSIITPEELGITSTRIGSVFGNHSVLFHSPADEIEFVHRAHNRSGFALGAVLAAEMTQHISGIFSFEEIIFDQSFTHH